jgi:DnaK suppressor protein
MTPATKAPASTAKAPAKRAGTKAVAKTSATRSAASKSATTTVATKAAPNKAAIKTTPKSAPATKATPTKAATKKVPAPAAAKAPAAKKAPAKAPAKAAEAPAKRPAASAAKAAPPARTSGGGIPRRKPGPGPFATDTKFLDEQRVLLDTERAIYQEQATALKAEADSLAQEREPGDVQFDEESGEGGTVTVDRERDLALSAQASLAVEEIDEAMERVKDKSYGACERCQQPIPKARLRALPYARLCVACKSGGLSRR